MQPQLFHCLEMKSMKSSTCQKMRDRKKILINISISVYFRMCIRLISNEDIAILQKPE